MSYPEAFAVNYDRWAAGVTEGVPLYVELARDANGPSSSSPSRPVASRFRWRGRSGAP